jgi:ParB-like chromosome segregation protein Spo0J
MDKDQIIEKAKELFLELKSLSDSERIQAINEIRVSLGKHSPFRSEPVDCVVWVPNEQVTANDYNPNSVAPAEMKLLEHSIREDGYTQPIVAWKTEIGFEVIDGFHRNRVGKESKVIKKRILSHLPLAVINTSRTDKSDRMASTIRHNRARGKHRVDSMADIVMDLRKRNWSDEKIARELGMSPDEVLRLCQITGIAEIFRDREFSKAWEAQTSSEQQESIDE